MKKNKLKVYSIYTDSHSTLFNNFFLPSLKNTDLELHSTEVKQAGRGNYNTEDYLNGILLKVRLIISAIKENFGNVFVFSDVDIIFFKNVSKDLLFRLKDKDILFQLQLDFQMNTGFFVCRANNKTLNLWQECEKRLVKSISLKIKMHDQDYINQIIKEKLFEVKFGFLPIDKYSFYGCMSFFDKNKKNNIFLSKNVHTYHAIGTAHHDSIENKKLLLLKAREIILNNQGMQSIYLFYLKTITIWFINTVTDIRLTLNFFIKKYFKFDLDTIVGKVGFFLKKNIPWLFNLLKPYFSNKK